MHTISMMYAHTNTYQLDCSINNATLKPQRGVWCVHRYAIRSPEDDLWDVCKAGAAGDEMKVRA